MAKYDIGPRIGIDGEAEFRKAIRNINTNIKTLGTEMLAVTSAYDANDKSVAALTARNGVLVKQIDAQKEKLAKLREGLTAAAAKYGESDENTQRWQQEVNKATAELNKMERQLKENTQELAGNTGKVSENTNELKSQGNVLSDLNSRLKAVGSGFAAAAKAAAAGIAATSAAIGALVKSSMEGYSEYEQLIGGVETLFQSSSDQVVQYANNAYKNAGLSANAYMETVTSFSASLLQSLGGDTAKAAKAADQAITDMSDNANKMGTSMESIQNAYQGFAKQNYTMLDNLKLGYGGTKEEMQRLLNDAEALSGVEYDISSFADIANAIHVVQTEMGITGTTAKEASTTIRGSVGAMKSAWENLVTGLASKNADMGQLIGNVMESVVAVGKNVIPRVQQILAGIGTAIEQVAPTISEQLPALIETILPQLLETGGQLLQALLDGIIASLPALTNAAIQIVTMLGQFVIDNLPILITAALTIITTLASGISTSLPELIPAVVETVLQIADTLTDPDNLDNVIDAALEIILSLADGLIDALPKLIEKAPKIVGNLVDAVVENAPKLLDAAFELVTKLASGIVNNLPEIAAKGREIVEKVISGIGELFSKLTAKGREIIDTVKSGVKEKVDAAKQWGKDLIQNFIDGITAKWTALKEKISSVAQTVKDFLGFSEPEEGPLSNFHTYAPDMMKLFSEGIRENADLIKSAFNDSLDFGTSKVFARIGGYMAEGLGEGFSDEIGAVQRKIDRSMSELAGNAAASVQVTGNVSGRQTGDIGGYLSDLPTLIAAAVRQELDGAGVYLNQRKVGELMMSWQNNQARAMGV